MASSNAILVWLAEGTKYFGGDAWQRALTLSWMFFEQYDHEPRLAVNRAIQSIFNTIAERRAEYDANFPKGYKALSVMENHLRATAEAGQGKPWFGAASASIADIALYAYTHVADQGGFSLADYPHIRAWLGEMERLPGHSRMTAS